MKLELNKLYVKRPCYLYFVWAAAVLLCIGLDQLTKMLCILYLKPVGEVMLWPGVLHLKFHLNDGAAFGSFSGQPYIFNTISVIIIIGLTAYLALGRANTRLSEISICMIIAGGIGNMIDRIAAGVVTDFIYFKLIDFAIFNVADSFVCVGCGLLTLSLLIELIREAKYAKADRNK